MTWWLVQVGKYTVIIASFYCLLIFPLVALWSCLSGKTLSILARGARLLLFILFWPFASFIYGVLVGGWLRKGAVIGLILLGAFIGAFFYAVNLSEKLVARDVPIITVNLSKVDLSELTADQRKDLEIYVKTFPKRFGSYSPFHINQLETRLQMFQHLDQLSAIYRDGKISKNEYEAWIVQSEVSPEFFDPHI